MKACALRIVLSILFSMPVFSQTFGEITAEVKDTAGAVIVGAKVTVTNTGTNATRETVTTGAGVYNFPSLQPRFYNIRVEQPGFRAAVENNIELQVQQTARLDFTLQVGQLGGTRANEQISVAGQRREFNYFTLDGVDNTDVNFNSYIIQPSIES